MMHVRTAKHEINAVQAHKHTEPSQNTAQKCKKQWMKKMEKQEFKDEYVKRSSVEGPFGILKEQFNIEKEVVIGMIRTEEKLN